MIEAAVVEVDAPLRGADVRPLLRTPVEGEDAAIVPAQIRSGGVESCRDR